MAKTTPRLCFDGNLSSGQDLALPPEQSHYLSNVLRLRPGAAVALFNGRDGEWLAYVTDMTRKRVSLRIERQTAAVKAPPDIDYVFAPLKHARLDYLVQKATELGARRLRPVMTARTIAGRVNLERMRANAVEAAEQCNLVFVPEVHEPVALPELLAGWEQGRRLIYCDEKAINASPYRAMAGIAPPAAILVGPEGGFTPAERELLRAQAYVTAISLGPRIMRADTVAIASLALVQSSIGDWS